MPRQHRSSSDFHGPTAEGVALATDDPGPGAGPVPGEPSPAARRQASFVLWLALVAAGSIVGALWYARGPSEVRPGVLVLLPVAVLSRVATLALLPGALFVLGHWVIASPRRLAWYLGGVSAVFLDLLYTDTVLYRLLRYHINAAVLNVVSTPGSEDAVHLGPQVWLLVAGSLVGISAAGAWIWRRSASAAEQRLAEGQTPARVLRPRILCLAVLLPSIMVDKAVYAMAELRGDHEVMSAWQPLPLRPVVSIQRLLAKDGEALTELEVLPEDARLAYPKAMPTVDPDGPRPNVLLLVIDSWRRDAFTPELTPGLHGYSRGARVFQDHLSGGNGTRFGVFSMLYGLHGSYWFPVLEERRSPVLLDVLGELGYERRVFSAASMNFPEFYDTAWSSLPPEDVEDEHGSRISNECDVAVARKLESWLRARLRAGDDRPFFSFVLLDSPHQPYYNPGGPYQPAAGELDYLELARSDDPELASRIHNRYRNSVLFADRVATGILETLAGLGLADETIVVVTGDHGEEFQECGFWGHTSNFSPVQVEVPFLLKGPGVEAGLEGRPTTHLDLPATLLELLGADPAGRGDYSLGGSLLDPPSERSRVVSGFADIGLCTDDGIFRLPLEAGDMPLEVYDREWRRQFDVTERVARRRDELERMARECLRFLSPAR